MPKEAVLSTSAKQVRATLKADKALLKQLPAAAKATVVAPKGKNLRGRIHPDAIALFNANLPAGVLPYSPAENVRAQVVVPVPKTTTKRHTVVNVAFPASKVRETARLIGAVNPQAEGRAERGRLPETFDEGGENFNTLTAVGAALAFEV